MSNLLEDAKRTVKPAIERKDFRVFVFGPSLLEAHTVDQPTTPICGHEDVEVHAKYLRYVTRLELEKLGFPVDYGESPDVLQFWQDNFLAPDLATIELNHAERLCGAVVVYPSSLGSICELGLFASREWLCRRTIAIVHSMYENASSFFRQGLLEYFDQEGGKHSFQDNADHPKCVAGAIKFVKKCYNSLQNAKVIHEETANRLKLILHG